MPNVPLQRRSGASDTNPCAIHSQPIASRVSPRRQASAAAKQPRALQLGEKFIEIGDHFSLRRAEFGT